MVWAIFRKKCRACEAPSPYFWGARASPDRVKRAYKWVQNDKKSSTRGQKGWKTFKNVKTRKVIFILKGLQPKKFEKIRKIVKRGKGEMDIKINKSNQRFQRRAVSVGFTIFLKFGSKNFFHSHTSKRLLFKVLSGTQNSWKSRYDQNKSCWALHDLFMLLLILISSKYETEKNRKFLSSK